jgi:hypothetical protein
MDPRRFDRLVKALSTSSTRRSIARLLAGVPLGVLLTTLLAETPETRAEDDDHGSSHRRHRRKANHRHQSGNNKEHRKGKRKGKGKKKRKSTDTGPTPTASACPPPRSTPVPTLTYQCPGPPEGLTASQPINRVAQTFTAAHCGSLQQIQFLVAKLTGTTGDFVVELLATAAGKPTNTVLAQVTVLDADVAEGDNVLVTAVFSGPQLVAGTAYAAAISRPDGSDIVALVVNARFIQTLIGTGPFVELSGGEDFIVSVTVVA